MKTEDYFGDLDIDVMIVLKSMLMKYVISMWIGFIWLRTEPNRMSLVRRD
jgi:hypothetical protein